MAANRKTKRILKLEEFEEQAVDALGQVPGYTLELDNGELITIPHPMLVTDEQQEQIERVQSGADVEEIMAAAKAAAKDGETPKPHIDAQAVRMARAVLGEDTHRRFIEGGGKSMHVSLAWAAMAKELEDKGPKLPR